jgi:anti-sigma regulatory factor (Ser/Thr protein kinase)
MRCGAPKRRGVAQPPEQYKRMVLASAEAVGPLRRALRRFARDHGASSATQAHVAFAFSEACGVLLGVGPGDGPGVLVVDAQAHDGELVVRVLNRIEADRPAPEPEVTGFGLPLMAHVCDSLAIEQRSDASGTAITMRFGAARPDIEAAPLPAGAA